ATRHRRPSTHRNTGCVGMSGMLPEGDPVENDAEPPSGVGELGDLPRAHRLGLRAPRPDARDLDASGLGAVRVVTGLRTGPRPHALAPRRRGRLPYHGRDDLTLVLI